MVRSKLGAVGVVGVVAAACLLGACGAAEPAGSDQAAASAAAADGQSQLDSGATNGTGGSARDGAPGAGATADAGGGATDVAAGKQDEPLPYLPWGPDTAPVPGQYQALAAAPGSPPRGAAVATDPDAQGAPTFWHFVARVCAAMTAGGAWPAGTTVPAPPDSTSAEQSCLNDELTALLKAAIRWHVAHPGAKPEVTYSASSSRSPCQDRIYATSAQPGSSPDRVEVTAAYATATGTHPQVFVDGEPIDDSLIEFGSAGELNDVTFELPASDEARTVQLALKTDVDLAATVEIPATVPAATVPAATVPAATGPSANAPATDDGGATS